MSTTVKTRIKNTTHIHPKSPPDFVNFFESLIEDSKWTRKAPVLVLWKRQVVFLKTFTTILCRNLFSTRTLRYFQSFIEAMEDFFPFLVGAVDYFALLCCYHGAIVGSSEYFYFCFWMDWIDVKLQPNTIPSKHIILIKPTYPLTKSVFY